MRRLFLMAGAACAAIAFTVACSKDDGGNGTDTATGSIEQDVVGNYDGTLEVSVTGQKPATQDQSITISMTENSTDAVDLAVTDFAFSGMEIGTITLTGLPVSESNGTYSFATPEPQILNLDVLGNGTVIPCSVTADGTVTNGKVSLTLDITVMAMTVNVTFEGDRTAAE